MSEVSKGAERQIIRSVRRLGGTAKVSRSRPSLPTRQSPPITKRTPLVVSIRLWGLETPVSAYLKLSRGRKGNAFFSISVEGGAARGRYR